MSVDELLAIEAERGKFISGGGWVYYMSSMWTPLITSSRKASEGPTDSELLALAAEADGTRQGAQKDEQKRQKDENWARYTEENAKGAGNTMNRG
jgi:hypothetical protein